MCVCVKHWEADSVYVLTYLADKNGSGSDSELGHMHRCTILFFNLLTAADLVSCDLTCLVLAPRSALPQRPSEWTWIRSESSAVTHRLLFCTYRVQLRQRTLIYIFSRGLTETMCRPSRCCHLDVPDKPEKQVSTKLECNPEPKQSSWALQPLVFLSEWDGFSPPSQQDSNSLSYIFFPPRSFFLLSWIISEISLLLTLNEYLEQVFISPSFIHWHGFFKQWLTSHWADVEYHLEPPWSEQTPDLMFEKNFSIHGRPCAVSYWLQGRLIKSKTYHSNYNYAPIYLRHVHLWLSAI